MERKSAIVTGSATGVGAATAILLAEKGCNVIINYTKSKKEADETAEIIRNKGVEAIVCQGDVANDDDCRAMAQAAVDAWVELIIWLTMREKQNSIHSLIWKV